MIDTILLFLLENSHSLLTMKGREWFIILLLLAFVWINISPSFDNKRHLSGRLRTEGNGVVLLTLFCITTVLSCFNLIYQAKDFLTEQPSIVL